MTDGYGDASAVDTMSDEAATARLSTLEPQAMSSAVVTFGKFPCP